MGLLSWMVDSWPGVSLSWTVTIILLTPRIDFWLCRNQLHKNKLISPKILFCNYKHAVAERLRYGLRLQTAPRVSFISLYPLYIKYAPWFNQTQEMTVCSLLTGVAIFHSTKHHGIPLFHHLRHRLLQGELFTRTTADRFKLCLQVKHRVGRWVEYR